MSIIYISDIIAIIHIMYIMDIKPQAIFSMCNGLHIQFWCFSIMFKQNIGVANTRDETDEYMIENCHNGCHKRYECHKGNKISI